MGPIPSNSGDYGVRIHYREPTHELRSGVRREPLLCERTVRAAGHEEALRAAMSEFREMKGASGVGWVRVVTKVEVTWVEPDARGGAKS